MMLIATLLVFGLIAAGCAGPSPPATPSQGGETTAAPNGTGTQEQAQGQQQEAQDQTQEQAQEQEQEQEGQPDSGADDLAGQTYEALAAMGVPLQCDVTVTYEGKDTPVHLYMRGSDEIRTEMPASDPEMCAKMVSIVKGGTFYYGCDGGNIMMDCAWMQLSTSGEASAGAEAGAEPPDYTDVPPAKISCVPWAYDSSKFATPGKVCSMDDIMNQYQNYGGYPPE